MIGAVQAVPIHSHFCSLYTAFLSSAFVLSVLLLQFVILSAYWLFAFGRKGTVKRYCEIGTIRLLVELYYCFLLLG